MIRFDVTDSTRLERLAAKGQELMKDISKKSELKKQGGLTIQQTFPRFSKPIIDEIDTVLAEHYGFTDRGTGLHHQLRHQVPYGGGEGVECC